MDIRKWASDPSMREWLAEMRMIHSIFRLCLSVATSAAMVAWVEMNWFVAFGLFVPLILFLCWIIVDSRFDPPAPEKGR